MIREITRLFFKQAQTLQDIQELKDLAHQNSGTPNQRIVQDLSYLMDEIRKNTDNLDKLSKDFQFSVLHENIQIKSIINTKSEDETTKIIASSSQEEKESLYIFCVLASKAIAQQVMTQIEEMQKHEETNDKKDVINAQH